MVISLQKLVVCYIILQDGVLMQSNHLYAKGKILLSGASVHCDTREKEAVEVRINIYIKKVHTQRSRYRIMSVLAESCMYFFIHQSQFDGSFQDFFKHPHGC